MSLQDKLDAFRAIPQQRLLGDVEPVEREGGHQPGAHRAPFRSHRRGDRGGDRHEKRPAPGDGKRIADHRSDDGKATLREIDRAGLSETLRRN